MEKPARRPKKIRTKKKRSIKEPLAVGFYRGSTFLLYREIKDGIPELFFLGSRTGVTFSGRPQKITLQYPDKRPENILECHHFRFFGHNEDIVLTYIRDDKTGSSLRYAATGDRKRWIVGGSIENVDTPAVLVPEVEEGSGDTAYFGNEVLKVAVSKNVHDWEITEPARAPYWNFFNGNTFRVAGALDTSRGIAVFYESEIVIDVVTDVGLQDKKVGEDRFLKIGAAFFSTYDPTELLFQTEMPFVESPLQNSGELSILGVVPVAKKDDTYRFYAATSQGDIGFFEFNENLLLKHLEKKTALLDRHPANPILSPTPYEWESHGAFNPTALALQDKVHLLYRAVGPQGSFIGYASSPDGVRITERLPYPIYQPSHPFEQPLEFESRDREPTIFASGGSWGGCEDPKVTQIGDRIYMTYVAHAGYWPMRTAITSISVVDFLNKKWKWTKPKLMSPPGVGSKSVVILPKLINDKYTIFHRIWPNIIVDQVPDLEFGENGRFLKNEGMIPPRRSYWDSQKLSMGAAPIETEKGWLAIYNAVDRFDSSKYKIGAMLLKHDDPKKVIARTSKPILSPDVWYENEGKAGVAYPGGAVDIDGKIHVYYGGGDTVSCVATIDKDELLHHLKKDTQVRMHLTPVSLS